MLERTRAMLGCGLCLVLAAAGCSDDGPKQGAVARPVDPARPTDITPDQPRNGAVELDEAGLRGVVRDGELELSIPVRGLKAGKGSITAELVTVDRSKVEDDAEVDYELEQGERETLTARLSLPDDVKEQADRIAYSVRVHAGPNLQITRSLLYVVSPVELRLEGPSALHAAKQGSYRVRAQHPLTREPLPGVEVSLELERGDETVETLKGETDDTGSAIFEVSLDEAGDYAVAVSSSGQDSGVTHELSGEITVKPAGQKLLLTTDKPIYQPGQTIHLRAMALKDLDNTPLANTTLRFEVSDGKGNKVFKKQRTTDEYGIASADFKLASLVNLGNYKLQVVSDVTAEKTVEVSRYVLPKFELRVATDRPWYAPGREVQGSVDGRYFFGKTLNGADVTIEALSLDVGAQVFQRVMGKLDAQGHFAFTIKLPEVLVGLPLQDGNALITLRTTVTDTAGQVVVKDAPVTVAAAGLRLSLVPEAAELVHGIENRFHLFVTDPLGAPIADAEVKLSGGAPGLTVRTDAFGYAEVKWTVDVATRVDPILAELTTKEGEKSSGTFSFAVQHGTEHVLVRTDKSLYALGEKVKVQVLATRGESRAYLDWLNDGQVVDMRTLELKDGVASFEVALDQTLIGENRIEAYLIDADGVPVRAGRSIVVNREGGLRVALSQDKPEYRPGEAATLTLSVTDETGKPAPAALGVQIVDEAVFGLIDARPGLLRTFFELEDSFAMPTYEIHVPAVSFEKLLFEDALAADPAEKRAAQTRAEAQLSALRGRRMMGLALASWGATQTAAKAKLEPILAAERKRLIAVLTPEFKAAREKLAAMGCKPEMYYCADSRPFATKLIELAMKSVGVVDLWGNAYEWLTNYDTFTLTSIGADERRGLDDLPFNLSIYELDPSLASGTKGDGSNFDGLPASPAGATPPAQQPPQPVGGPVGAAGAAAQAPGGTQNPESPSAESEPGPRVRKEFPETLYVNPALITDGEGKATVSLDMADSITSWRVSALANAKSGALGGGQAGVTVFQDFFVDVNFPAELTRGDQVEFPIVVYNYLKTEQTVRLELEQANWFSALGQTTVSLTLPADSVQSTKIPVRVDRVGTQTLTVRAFGSNASDAVARSVRVVPDGVAVQRAQSGSLAPGEISLGVEVPAAAVAGSPQLYVDVYPAFTSQAVKGLDSMLQVPSGCFEQTTSTTWPNVLVTRYLEQTKQHTPEIQAKAESLISAGYQRLVTFEHAGGGFSWFGEDDPMPDVSVTAFGVMEFADMAKVAEVDPELIARTQNWLAQQQAADGSFAGGRTEFFSFQTSALRNTAFTVWALGESGYTGDALERGLDYVREHLDDAENDTYTLALAANALAAAAPTDASLSALLTRLDGLKKTDGAKQYWPSGTQQTCFYGGGTDSDVSTTALIAYAMMRASSHPATVKGALEYILGSKDTSGNFGSTQASIWSLKALMLAASRGTDGAVGELKVSVDGALHSTLQLEKDQWDVSTRVDLSSLATSGAHAVGLAFAGTGQVSYSLVSGHHLPWAQAPRPATGPLAIAVSYDRTQLAVDEIITATLRVTNQTRSTQNMLLVTVGIPPGFELQTEELDGYVQTGVISRYERTAKQLILYVTEVGPSAATIVQYRLRASMPVRAADGGSQVYLYYQPDQRGRSDSTQLVVTGS